jgi:hypothetical protein
VVILPVIVDIVDNSIHNPVDQFKHISTDFRICFHNLDIWVIEMSMLSVRLCTPPSEQWRRAQKYSSRWRRECHTEATFLGGFGGMPPKNILKSRTTQMAFPAISRVEWCH